MWKLDLGLAAGEDECEVKADMERCSAVDHADSVRCILSIVFEYPSLSSPSIGALFAAVDRQPCGGQAAIKPGIRLCAIETAQHNTTSEFQMLWERRQIV